MCAVPVLRWKSWVFGMREGCGHYACSFTLRRRGYWVSRSSGVVTGFYVQAAWLLGSRSSGVVTGFAFRRRGYWVRVRRRGCWVCGMGLVAARFAYCPLPKPLRRVPTKTLAFLWGAASGEGALYAAKRRKCWVCFKRRGYTNPRK